MIKDNLSKRILLVIFGQVLISIGVTLLIYVNIGADPLGVFHTGVANFFNISFATALFLENIVAIILVFLIDKKYLNIATIFTLFVVSMTTGVINNIYLMFIPQNLPFIINIILVLISCGFVAIGLNFYILADLGVGAMDAAAEMVSDKSGIEYRYVKIVSDLGFLLVGYLLGGVVGVGTIISAFIVGPIIQYTRKYMKIPINNFIGN